MSVFNPKSSRQKAAIHGRAIPSFFLGFLLLLSCFSSFSQNTLDNAGLTSSTYAASAYSLRKLSSTYSGSAIQVRRSSDNTTQNIGFTGNDLDTASLKTFVGSGNGFVTIWYDQSGNARNLTQTTENMQPVIVNAGTIFRRNFRPTIYYDNANDGMVFTGSAYLSNNPITVNVVAGSNSNTAAFRRGVQGSANWLIGPYNNQHSWFAGTGFNHQETTPWSTTNIERLTVIQDVRPFSWRNGTEIVIPNMVATNNLGTPGHIYTGTGGSGNEPLDGFISEVICFSSNIGNTARQTLDENQNGYYSAPENALHFDGSNDFVNLGTSSPLDIRSSMTVELWIRPTTNMGNGKWDRLVHRNFGTGYFFGGKAGSTNALAVVLNNNINLVATPNNTVTVNEWQHVAFVFDDVANTVKIYRNGIEVASASYTGTIAGGAFNCTLSDGSEHFGGAMDEVRIWNVARTQAQLQANMGSSISAATTGLVAYYNFNQGNPGGTNTGLTTLVDATSNAINGTLNGFALTGTNSNWIASTAFGTLSNNADLSALTTTAGTLSPSFAAATTAYTASAANATTSVTVTPTRAEANATLQVRVNGGTYAAVTSGSASGALALNVGNNTIDVLVTAQNGTTTKTYTITVTRSASNNADLNALTTTAGTLTPSFAAATTAYTASVANATTSVTVTPTVADATATIQVQVNGGAFASVTSGSASDNLSLNVGSNTINVTVTAQDGITTKTYTITVTRTPIPPTITSFTPLSAKPGDAVTITGTNFNSTAANNIVFFGATRATVTAATATSLTVTVPAGATYAPITLLNTGTNLAAYSLANFHPIYSPAKTDITASDFLPKQDFTTGDQPYSVAIGDLDGDGKPDLVVANYASSSVSIFRNTSTSGSVGAGSFAARVNFTTGNGPNSVAIGDLDGDGKPDLAVTNQGSASVSVLRNTSNSGSIDAGSFAAKQDFTTGPGSNPISVAIGDLDGDGRVDLAVANFGSNTVSVFRNTNTSGSISAGSFAAKQDFSTGASSRPTSVAIADLDGDGKSDLVVTNRDLNTVSVFRNTSTSGSIGSSSFAAKQDFATGANPFSVAIGDLDGDGKPDLAVTNISSISVSVLRNTSTSGSIGSGSFATKQDFTTGANPISVAIGDVDGDSKPDLAVANISSDNVSLLRNTSTSGSIGVGSFAAKVDFATGDAPRAVAIGDLDGDGKPDLIVANSNSSNMSVLRNADITTTWNGSTWSNGAPTSTIDAIIGSSTAPASFTCRALTINSGVALTTTGITATVNGNIVNNGNGIAGTGTLAINGNSTISGDTITLPGTLNLVTGTLTTGGLLRIAPTGAITGNYANISGTVTLQQNVIGQRGWRVFSNPFTTTQTIATLASNNGITISNTASGASGLTDVRTYTNGTGWNNVTANTLAANTPYALFIRGLANEVTGLTYTGGPTAFTYNASGTLNGNSVTITPSATGFTLVGNPFAAPVNSSALTNGAGKSYFVYQIERNGDGRTRRGGWSAQLTSNATTPIPTLGVIAYQAGNNTSYDIRASTDINTTNAAATGLFRTQQSGQTQQTQQQNQTIENLALVVEQNGVLQDNLFIRQDEASTSGTNDTKDLLKLTNDNVNFYTVVKASNQRLAVDARDVRKDNATVPLGITAAQGNYTLRVTNNNIEKVEATLVDNYLQTRTELTQNTTYNFSVTADSNTRGNNRFEVQFSNKLSTNPAAITATNTGFTAKVLGNSNVNNMVSIEVKNAQKQVTITVTDAQGRVLATKQGTNGINRVQVSLTNGIYLVQVTDGNSIVTEKILN